MSRFFTRQGDDGYTGLLGEGRIPKYHPRTEALGTIDEASAALGMARAVSQAGQTASLLLTIQRDLYGIMAEIAATPDNAPRFRTVGEERVHWLETQVNAASGIVQMPGEFVVPGDTQAGAALSLARTIVRRAERRTVELLHAGEIENIHLVHYLNRLSSLCFVLELLEVHESGKETPTLAKSD